MKKWIVRSLFMLLAVFLLIGVIPFSEAVYYCGTDYEFSPIDETLAIPHEVIVEGTYSTIFLLKDRFYGTVFISDVEGMEEAMPISVSCDPTRFLHPDFQDLYGQAHSTEIMQMFFTRNFEQLAFQFAIKFERDEDSLTAWANDKESNFMVLGAKNREEAYTQYQQLLKDKG